MNRRYFLTAASMAGLTSIAGCLDVVTGDGPVELMASPSNIPQAVLDQTGFALEAQNEVVIEREFEVASETRQVVVTNHQSEYAKSIDLGPLGDQRGAVFTALTTPQVNVLGREFNPVADKSTTELAEMVQDQYDDIRSLTHVEDTDVTIYGETAVQSKFQAEATLVGEAVDLYIHISEAVEMGNDLVITVGGYPELTPDEGDNILRLMEAVEPAT